MLLRIAFCQLLEADLEEEEAAVALQDRLLSSI